MCLWSTQLETTFATSLGEKQKFWGFLVIVAERVSQRQTPAFILTHAKYALEGSQHYILLIISTTKTFIHLYNTWFYSIVNLFIGDISDDTHQNFAKKVTFLVVSEKFKIFNSIPFQFHGVELQLHRVQLQLYSIFEIQLHWHSMELELEFQRSRDYRHYFLLLLNAKYVYLEFSTIEMMITFRYLMKECLRANIVCPHKQY